MPDQEPAFHVTGTEWYIKLEYTRQPTPEDMKAANVELLEFNKEQGLNELLCDVRKMNREVPLATQLEGVKLLWQLRSFKKFAFIVGDPELEKLLASSFRNLSFLSKFRAFQNEDEAVAWLRSNEQPVE